MSWQSRIFTAALAATSSASVLAIMAPSADAGGFAIREQSAYYQGMSFAGSAAGDSLSTMFWNSAAAVTQEGGLQTESHFSLIIPQSELTATTGTTAGLLAAFDNDTGIGRPAVVPASYASYQLTSDLYLGLATNGAFGLSTEPHNSTWAGAQLARNSSLFTTNVNPMISYKISNQLAIGAGAQVQWGSGKFKFATTSPTDGSTFFKGDGFGFGGTAGIMWTPTPATSVGLGYRSQLNQNLDGNFRTQGVAAGLTTNVDSKAELKLPDIVTLSVKQELSPRARAFATVEWSNWSRFQDLTVEADGPGSTVSAGVVATGDTIAAIPAEWQDGWFFSLGGEYDYSDKLQLRAGIAYEISPIDDPRQRLSSIPDADRLWLSVGAGYKINDHMALDLAYTHIFVEEATLDRLNVAENARLVADVDSSVDIVSASLKSRW